MRTEKEVNWEMIVCVTCGVGMLIAALWANLQMLWVFMPVIVRGALCAVGTLIVAAGLWICAWECGRRWERENGKRVCGCVG